MCDCGRRALYQLQLVKVDEVGITLEGGNVLVISLPRYSWVSCFAGKEVCAGWFQSGQPIWVRPPVFLDSLPANPGGYEMRSPTSGNLHQCHSCCGRYTLGGFYLARYTDSPVGPFDEVSSMVR
jgi:hypothetical protein